MPEAELGQRLVPFLERAGLDPAGGPDAGAVAALLRDRAETLVAMADAAWYFYSTPAMPPDKLAEQVTPANRAALAELHGEFATLAWTREALVAAIKARRRAAWAEAGADHDAAAPAGGGNAVDAGHRRRARAAGARRDPRADGHRLGDPRERGVDHGIRSDRKTVAARRVFVTLRACIDRRNRPVSCASICTPTRASA